MLSSWYSHLACGIRNAILWPILQKKCASASFHESLLACCARIHTHRPTCWHPTLLDELLHTLQEAHALQSQRCAEGDDERAALHAEVQTCTQEVLQLQAELAEARRGIAEAEQWAGSRYEEGFQVGSAQQLSERMRWRHTVIRGCHGQRRLGARA